MVDIENISYFALRKLLISKKLLVKELVEYSLLLAEKEAFNAFREITADYALKQAKISQSKIDAGKAGLLEGLTVAVKDNFCSKGITTTACSRMLKNFVPDYESTVTGKIFSAGAIMIGKTNMDEFAMGSSNTNSYFGNVINPWKQKNNDINLIPGGSSGGSAVAVATRICAAALGTDTGGSVRLPASFTGTIGVKPTYGRCSRYGMISFASSFDQAGVFTNNIQDSAMVLQSMCGFDIKDGTTKNIAPPNLLGVLGKSIKGVKIGIPREYLSISIHAEIKEHIEEVCKALRSSGAEIITISLPSIQYSLAAYYIISSAEMSSNLARYDGVRYGTRIEYKDMNYIQMVKKTRSECFGKEVKKRIMMGTYVLSSNHFCDYFQHAKKIRRIIYNEFADIFNNVNIIITPTSKSTAFPISAVNDSIQLYNNDIFTIPSSLTGLPSLSMPIGLDKKGLPIGMQLISSHFAEEDLYRIAYVIERNMCFQHKISLY